MPSKCPCLFRELVFWRSADLQGGRSTTGNESPREHWAGVRLDSQLYPKGRDGDCEGGAPCPPLHPMATPVPPPSLWGQLSVPSCRTLSPKPCLPPGCLARAVSPSAGHGPPTSHHIWVSSAFLSQHRGAWSLASPVTGLQPGIPLGRREGCIPKTEKQEAV